jgi:predicted NAD-dependent protein-ADP-ribosyltransferase YbiA (DUF1768 family)
VLRREPQEQFRRAVAAWTRKRDQKIVKTSLALEAKALGRDGVKFQQPSWR